MVTFARFVLLNEVAASVRRLTIPIIWVCVTNITDIGIIYCEKIIDAGYYSLKRFDSDL